ncbi:hypothetical protein BB561_002911 [Smittium simulii]|uniref:Uncharacterized protein n=1 Tax=Smittium simulii TaxID=133385 RepID=A0A2T9YNR0_9FUNG|nr:hypothetical protein BB561_002911 [Smittium simulii]
MSKYALDGDIMGPLSRSVKAPKGERQSMFPDWCISDSTSAESKVSAPDMELETAKFMNVIHVARVLIVDNIKCSPTSLNQCQVGMEALLSRSKVR